MAAPSVFAIKVDRLCRIRSGTSGDESPFPLDEDGFLDPSALAPVGASTAIAGALVSPSVAAAGGALVLLGEPGVGKTTVFEQLTGGSPTEGADLARSTAIWVDAAEVVDATFEDLLGRHLRGLPPRPVEDGNLESPSTDVRDVPAVTIVIDQIDESPMLHRLPGRLRDALDGRETSGLVLLLACRTADYPANLTTVLERACGDCVLADLAPLTRDEAVRLTSSASGTDGEALIGAAVAVGAGVLASVPLTLELLVRTYRRTGSLDARPKELFAQGVEQLVAEHDVDRRVIDDETTGEQRRIIAGRIAARMLLCGIHTIWQGRTLESGEQDLDADGVVGGEENSSNGRFPVTKRAVRATLGTALFTGRGTNRLAFRHGSIAAYLAARYLNDREVPGAQLERLFLVAGGDETRTIPALLRETAAWLVTLEPAHADWLVQADPESLAGYSPIVDSSRVRALVVDALLSRANEVELGDTPWTRGARRLEHPGLSDQLMRVFGSAEGREPEDWSTVARLRLAVRLARESKSPDLAAPLLDIAESDAWSAYMRRLAARAAVETNRAAAIPRLRDLLERFADIRYATEIDPDDEFRGSLLDMLWPDHLSTDQVLPHLRPRRVHNLLGMYAVFEYAFSEQLPEEDIPAVLQWAKERLHGDSQAAGLVASDDDQSLQDAIPSERPVGSLDTPLIEGIVDRALAGATALDHLADVAALLWPRLSRSDRPPLPSGVDLQDEHGREPDVSRDLRRALARSLVEVAARDGDFNRMDSWVLIEGWSRNPGFRSIRESLVPPGLQRANRTRLLTGADLQWLYQAATDAGPDGNAVLANALGQLAAMVYNPEDPESVDLVYTYQDHPAWRHLKWWFEPVDLNSEDARRSREAHGGPTTAKRKPWPDAEQFASRLNRWAREAAGGYTDAFWQLAWSLQMNPATGQGQARFDDDLLDYPGVAALDGDPLDMLTAAATHYVINEHDHATEWLGSDTYDKR